MNCQQVDDYVFSYCDGELAPSLFSELESHIANCLSCQAKVELTRMENEILRSGMNIPVLSDSFSAELMAAICNGLSGPAETAAARTNRPWYTRTPLWLAATAAAFVLLLYTVSPGIFSSNKNIAQHKSSTVKVAEKNPATNAMLGGRVEQKMEKNHKEKAVLDQNISEQQAKPATVPATTATDESENQLRTMMTVGNAGETNSELFMKRDSCPDRDRTDAPNLKLPAGVTFGCSAAPMILNMPSSYHIVNTSNQSDTWTYFYEGNGKQITISLNSNSELQAKTYAVPEAAEAPAAACIGPECGDAGSLKADSLNSVYRSIEIDDVSYQLTITGELSLDELNTLASTITVKK